MLDDTPLEEITVRELAASKEVGTLTVTVLIPTSVLRNKWLTLIEILTLYCSNSSDEFSYSFSSKSRYRRTI